MVRMMRVVIMMMMVMMVILMMMVMMVILMMMMMIMTMMMVMMMSRVYRLASGTVMAEMLHVCSATVSGDHLKSSSSSNYDCHQTVIIKL